MALRPALGGAVLTGALLCLAAPAAQAGKVRPWRPVSVPKLTLRFHLTSDWGVSSLINTDQGWKWEAFSPGQVAWIRLTSSAAPQELSEIAAYYISRVRAASAQAVAADPHGSFRSSRVRLAGVPAVEITIRAAGLTLYGNGETTTITYALTRGGRLYVFEFDASNAYLAKYRPTFDRLIATTRFTSIA